MSTNPEAVAKSMGLNMNAEPAALNSTGFVKSMPADMKPPAFAIARYKPERCAEHGGARGHGLERRQIKNAKARTDDNPDGLFWEYVIKLTAPCPVVFDDGPIAEIKRAEPGTIVVVVLDEQIEAAEPYFESKEWCAELAFVPFLKNDGKGRKKDQVWGFAIGVSGKPALRSDLVKPA